MDFIDSFLAATEGMRSPPIFRLWAAISCLAGILQRRVYTYTHVSTDPLCPNLYVVLVGSPASGKSLAINEVKKLWSRIRGFHIASDNVTKASFVTELQGAIRTFMNGSGIPAIFCSLGAPIAEFGVFIPRFDMEFLSTLTHIWDNPPKYREPRVSLPDREVDMPNLNIISGVAPDFLGELFPEVAWSQGFTARFLFIYSENLKFDNKNYFKKRPAIDIASLVPFLESAYNLSGEFEWSVEAQEAHIEWLDAGEPGAPEHNRLKHYSSRRAAHIAKLAMISAVSAGHGLFVELSDLERARTWLFAAEAVMPDTFRAMGQKSDTQIIFDLHEHLYTLYSRVARDQRQPIADEIVWTFLSERAPSMTIPRIIETAERSGVIRRAPGMNSRPRWIPRPRGAL